MHEVQAAPAASVAYEILAILWDGPRDPGDILTACEERRGFRPRPETLGPTLDQLEAGAFVSARTVDGKHIYTIAERGSTLLAGAVW